MSPRISTKTADAILARLPRAVPVEGGPLSLTPAAFAALLLLPWACDPQIQAALMASSADAEELGRVLTLPGIEDQPHLALHELSAAVAQLRPGARLALVTANTGKIRRERTVSVDRVLTAGNMRFEGRMDSGRMVRIEHALPPATADRLGAVAALLERVHDARDDRWGASAAELRAARDAGRRSWFFTRRKDREAALTGEGEPIAVAPEFRPFVAMLLLRLRFADGPWDMKTYRALDERAKGAWDASQQQVAAIATRTAAVNGAAHPPRPGLARTTPARGGVELLASPRGRYRAAAMTDTAAAFDARPTLLASRFLLRDDPRVEMGASLRFAEAVALVDAAMAEHGFATLGDVATDALGDAGRLRGYAGGVPGVWGMLAANAASGAFDWSLFSRAADGRWVVTTTHESDAPAPAWALRVEATAPVGVLLTKHRAQVAALGAPLFPAPTQLAEFAALVDAYVARQTER